MADRKRFPSGEPFSDTESGLTASGRELSFGRGDRESIRGRRGVPWDLKLGEARIGRIKFAASQRGVRVYAQGAIEPVAVFASGLLFALADARVSILWVRINRPWSLGSSTLPRQEISPA
jgi:hypothetical protein